jgi:hypothetical protein
MDTRNSYAGEEFYAHLMLGAHLVEGGVRFRPAQRSGLPCAGLAKPQV